MFSLGAASLIVIGLGVLCIVDTAFAWWLYASDCRLRGTTPPRLGQRDLRVKQVGASLVALGILGLHVSLM